MSDVYGRVLTRREYGQVVQADGEAFIACATSGGLVAVERWLTVDLTGYHMAFRDEWDRIYQVRLIGARDGEQGRERRHGAILPGELVTAGARSVAVGPKCSTSNTALLCQK